MSKSNVAHTYSPTEELESGTFPAAPRVSPVDAQKVGPEAPAEDSRDGDANAARLALYEALCVLARAAARLSHGGVR
jgi:hypothetical protein